ncbi:MAG: hypothetical protein O2958_01290 [Gemmatimonadetes bacterium]|nr:hypothetical protein [Gemmatimonadota bacterium]MDA1104138.1 hypothetical protein [Gemmatimonadota bacterium]
MTLQRPESRPPRWAEFLLLLLLPWQYRDEHLGDLHEGFQRRVGEVRWMVFSQGARLLAVGIAVGLVASLGLSRLLGSLVYGISATDPVSFVGIPAVLALVALAANLIPARRATRMDPATTLRSD